MSDRLFNGCPFRILTIVDCHTREALATSARTNFRAYQVIEELDRIARARGKPTDNAYIEAFNSRLRQECLNASWFLSMADARRRINDWKEDFNETRPHSALGNLTPT